MKNILYSYTGKILRNDEENFLIAIWPDVPFYLSIPKECEEFIKLTMKNSFYYSDIEAYFKSDLNIKLFNILKNANIINDKNINYERKNNINKLYYISFQLTNRCNLKCPHCYAMADFKINNNELTLSDIEKFVNELKSISNIEECIPILTGGEPLVRKDYLEIVDAFLRVFKNVVIVTNGTLWTDENIRDIAKRKNILLQISLDGASEQTNDKIRGKGSFKRIINTIKKCIENNIKVSLSPLCSESFFNEIDEYVQLAYELKVHNIQFQPVQIIGRAMMNKINRADGKKIIDKIYEYYFDEKYKGLINTGLESKSVVHVRCLNRLCNCGTGNGTMYISSIGDIYSCPNMKNEKYKIGNVLKDDVKDLYYNSKVYNELRSIDLDVNLDFDCKICEFKRFCGGGCRGVSLANKGSLYSKACECESLKSYFNEILWKICKNPNFFKEEADKWIEIKLKQKY